MPETLEITRSDIRIAIGREFGLGEDPDNEWNDIDNRRSKDWIRRGLSSIYTPDRLDGEAIAHTWSFLFPTRIFTFSGGVSSYLLPEDFGGLHDDKAYYTENEQVWHQLTLVPIMRIDQARAEVAPVVSSAPVMAYIGPIKSNGATRQRSGIEVWPTPSGSFSVKFQYYSNPFLIEEDTPYPLGGQPMADAILVACLAAAETTLQPESTKWREEFKRVKRAAIDHDRKHMQQVRNMGSYGDRGRNAVPDDIRHRTRGTVLYNGVDYSNG